MGVMMQAFYWDCPRAEQKEFAWWRHVEAQVDALADAGVTALWLPPASKAANLSGPSMGYDVYDYWDLGAFDQKGSIRTWFGSEAELRSLIATAHRRGLAVYADLVLNHNSGGDAEEPNPITGTSRWTRFLPRSGRFTRDWTCFNPSPFPNPDPGTFGDMPDLCHLNPRVSTNLLNLAKWLVEDVGFDGFRYDYVKGFAGWVVRAIHDRTYRREGREVALFGVGECWDQDSPIDQWLDSVNRWANHRASAFDFPLRERLKGLCDRYGFSLRALAEGGVLMRERPFEAVTFVDNHDFRGADEVVQDKLLAYAFILTHEGYPCVYWKDWFTHGLARPGDLGGLVRLVEVHERYAGGATELLTVDDDFYAMARTGHVRQPGLVFALNNSGATQRRSVALQGRRGRLEPRAWSGGAQPAPLIPGADGAVTLTVPSRGYVAWG